MEFKDLFELATREAWYESVLLDEQDMKNSSKGSYYKDRNYEVYVTDLDFDFGKVDIAEVACKWPIICSALSKPVNNKLAIKK